MTKRQPMLLYIHGFNSSPLSHKAQVMLNYCKEHRPDIKVLIPRLPCFPAQTAEYLLDIVEQYQEHYQIALVGSSLGGYLSIWLNHLFDFRVVLINPAIKPYELLADFLGEQVNPYTQEHYVLQAKHIEELKALEVSINNVNSLWLLQQMGDEVLDYHQAVNKLVGSKQTVELGGDHSFVNFERYPQQIIDFLKL
ncbi:esterase YqiA [Vibrio sp. SA48]|uniref:esterase YqiA n=1 Tax=Vibrio sp. S12_S33 TaxID=2720223 RepID=UPI00177F9386|nr:esterase YqiA [Vibrio sp. S12_S33]